MEAVRELVAVFWAIGACVGGLIILFTVLAAVLARRRDRPRPVRSSGTDRRRY